MPIADADKRRRLQRELKSKQRSEQKLLMSKLDLMVPPSSPAIDPANQQKQRPALNLLHDLVAYLRSCAERQRAQEQKRAIYTDMMSCMLLSRRERIILADIPSWTIRDVSGAVHGDYEGSCFGGRLVSLHGEGGGRG